MKVCLVFLEINPSGIFLGLVLKPSNSDSHRFRNSSILSFDSKIGNIPRLFGVVIAILALSAVYLLTLNETAMPP